MQASFEDFQIDGDVALFMLAVQQVIAAQGTETTIVSKTQRTHSSQPENLSKKATPYHDILVQRFRDDPQEAAAYLQAVLQEFQKHGQVALLVTALQRLYEARDIPLALLPQPISAQSITTLADFQKMLDALGYTLSITPKDSANETQAAQATQAAMLVEPVAI